MAKIQIRGGSFKPGGHCRFRDDHFHFQRRSLLTSAEPPIYVGDIVGWRLIDQETTEISLGLPAGFAMGAAAGAFFGPPGALTGAVIGSVTGLLARSNATELTFEVIFRDQRFLAGTTDLDTWIDIMKSYEISTKISRPAPAVVAQIEGEATLRTPATAVLSRVQRLLGREAD